MREACAAARRGWGRPGPAPSLLGNSAMRHRAAQTSAVARAGEVGMAVTALRSRPARRVLPAAASCITGTVRAVPPPYNRRWTYTCSDLPR